MFPPELHQKIKKSAIIAVLVIDDAANAVPLARALLRGGIDAMELKNVFCQIDTDCCSVHSGPSLFSDGFEQIHRGPLRGRLEEGRVHSIC